MCCVSQKDEKILSYPRKIRFWHLLGVLFKISYECHRPFYMGVTQRELEVASQPQSYLST